MREVCARLGIGEAAIRSRLVKWGEAEALHAPKGTLLRPRRKGIPNGARPGVKLSLPNPFEVKVLQALSEGIQGDRIAQAFGKSKSSIYCCMDRMRLKFNAFTTAEMIAEGFRKGFIQ